MAANSCLDFQSSRNHTVYLAVCLDANFGIELQDQTGMSNYKLWRCYQLCAAASVNSGGVLPPTVG